MKLTREEIFSIPNLMGYARMILLVPIVMFPFMPLFFANALIVLPMVGMLCIFVIFTLNHCKTA